MIPGINQAQPNRIGRRRPPREVRIEEIVDQYAGGTQSVASVAVIDGKTKFLKSAQPSRHGRYANFEADILAHDIFELAGIDAPDAELVTLPEGELRDYLGKNVLAIEFVDTNFTNGDKVHTGGWGPPENADLDSYLTMTLLDVVMGNPDRRGANYFTRHFKDGKARPIPIDNDSAFGNVITHKVPTNHMSFVRSYHPKGSTPGVRQNGSIGNLMMDTMLHYDLWDEPAEQSRALQLAAGIKGLLSDQKIDDLVDRLPRQVIPEDLTVSYTAWKKSVDPQTLEMIANETPDGISGDELFEFRKEQLKQTLRWRRDNLKPALQAYFRELNDPNVDPIRRCSDDWEISG